MSFRYSNTFHVVSIHLNFTKAAHLVNYSQPTISQHIKAMEEGIGHTFLNKVGKEMFITHVGEI